MPPLRTAVIGVGHLGAYHAEKYANLAQSHLAAVCDTNPDRAERIAKQYQTKAVFHYEQLLDQVDAVSIATPTKQHYAIAKFFLRHGIHVLLEKPMTRSLAEADDLIQTAKQHNAILQIGHIERFNAAQQTLSHYLNHPLFFESVRLAPFKLRGTDINVILDLMIHDIDIIQSLVKQPVISIQANGAPIFSHFTDIANARITFDNGCVANVSASRISFKQERRMRIFQPDAYLWLDFDEKKLVIHRKIEGELMPGIPNISDQTHHFEQVDALKDQIASFLTCIIDRSEPIVSGNDGKQALATAMKITEIIRHQWDQFGELGEFVKNKVAQTDDFFIKS